MNLSIIIVSWNVKADVLRCLQSIQDNAPACDFETILVDNASSDDTVQAVNNSYPDVVIIDNKDNRGFAAANNQGIEKAKGRYILLLNQDTIVPSQAFDTLLEFMETNKDVGVCAPRLLNEDMTIQPSVRRFPTFKGSFYRHTAFRFLRLYRKNYRQWLMKDFDHKSQMDVDQVMGAAMLIRKEALEQAGVLDESFFMYYEEVDLCYRIKAASWRIVFLPQAEIIHLGGRSSGQVPVEKRIMMLTSLMQYFRKHEGYWRTFAFSLLFKPAIIIRDIIDLLSGFITLITALVFYNKKRRNRSIAKIRNSALLLTKYSCRVLFRI